MKFVPKFKFWEGVYVTIRNPTFCLFLYLTGGCFRGELQYGDDVSQQKITCRPFRAREVGGVSLSDVLYVGIQRFAKIIRNFQNSARVTIFKRSMAYLCTYVDYQWERNG